MLKNGKNLSDITQWMCEKFAVESKVIPITDNTVETRITANGEDLHLQEFWVKHRGRGTIEGIQYVGADKARPNPEAINAIHDSDMVIIAPGNPLTSIGPMLQIKGIRKGRRRETDWNTTQSSICRFNIRVTEISKEE